MNTSLCDKAYLTSFIDAMGDMVRVVTRDGKVALSNSAFKRDMGDKPNDACFSAIGRKCECMPCLTKKVLKDGNIQTQIRKIDGRVYSVTASPLTNKDGEYIGVIESFRDITIDYKLKQELLLSNTKMQNDLQLARRLQFSLVKKNFDDLQGVKLTAGFFPCEAVGGDIYDCFEIDGKIVLYVSDVSGHGVTPAMLAVFVIRTIKQICEGGELSPAQILKRLQEQFSQLDIEDSMYITAFVAVLDSKTGNFVYSNAGLSVPPLLYNASLTELYLPSQPICGWFHNPEFPEEKQQIDVDGRLILFTDGIHQIHKQKYAFERFCELFVNPDFNGEAFVNSVRSELHARPKDDLTMLICERKMECVEI